MPAHKKPTPLRFCNACGTKLERKLLPNGDLESLIHFNRRKYCDRDCMAKGHSGQRKPKLKWSAAHRRARQICPPGPCVKCGKPDASDVHHVNGDWNDQTPTNLERICRGCHNRKHRQRKPCMICGKPQKGFGYCAMHYQRFKKWGDPLAVKPNQHTPLTQSGD